jgi:hypothetical protein
MLMRGYPFSRDTLRVPNSPSKRSRECVCGRKNRATSCPEKQTRPRETTRGRADAMQKEAVVWFTYQIFESMFPCPLTRMSTRAWSKYPVCARTVSSTFFS